MAHGKLAVFLAGACGILLSAEIATASEGEKAVAVSVSYAALADTADGVALGVSFDSGIRDQLFWHIAAGGGTYFGGDETFYSGQATLGIKYLLLDIVKYVPYAAIGVGASVLAGESIDTAVDPRLELGLGFDVLATRSFSYGIEARFEVAAPRAAFDQSALFFAGAKIAWRWGFF